MQKKVIASKITAKSLKGFENVIFTIKYDTPINAQIYFDAINSLLQKLIA